MRDQGGNKVTKFSEGQGVTWKLDKVHNGAAIIKRLDQRHQYIQTKVELEVDKLEDLATQALLNLVLSIVLYA